MQPDKYDVMRAVAQTISGEPIEFEKTINGILAKKVETAVDQKREEVASSLFGPPEIEAQPEDNSDPVSTETLEDNSDSVSTETPDSNDEENKTPSKE